MFKNMIIEFIIMNTNKYMSGMRSYVK